MSEAVGTLSIGETGEEVFIGREWVQNKNFSEDTARLVDSEVKRIVEEAHSRCLKLLQDNVEVLHRIAAALLERETITGSDLDLLLENKELPPLDSNGKPVKPTAPEGQGGDSGAAPVATGPTDGTGAAAPSDKNADFTLEPDSDAPARPVDSKDSRDNDNH